MSKPNRLAECLSTILADRSERNARYSLRAFSRDLGVQPGDLSRFLRGAAFPGIRNLRKIADGLQRAGDWNDDVMTAMLTDIRDRILNQDEAGEAAERQTQMADRGLELQRFGAETRISNTKNAPLEKKPQEIRDFEAE